jgi:hypothetical protein
MERGGDVEMGQAVPVKAMVGRLGG